MSSQDFISPDIIRASFSQVMSAMYRDEVPLYGDLISLVATVNAQIIEQNQQGAGALNQLARSGSLESLSEERHGAIRLGTAEELNTMRRLFAVMGMYPVDYYDLTVAGIPVHSTAFRPVSAQSLEANPFRVFTSLLRLDLIEDEALREQAEAILARRKIFTDKALELINTHEQRGGLSSEEAELFVKEALETFRWHEQALVDKDTYEALRTSHALTADIVSFKGPHINHLTPRTLDIDAAQTKMVESGMAAKAIIEGPPARKHAILLRQTSFKALEEAVVFQQNQADSDTPDTNNAADDTSSNAGSHTARFGEIEQRGMALTPKGRELYDQLLAEVRKQAPKPESDPEHYRQTLQTVFADFPDDLETLRRDELAYFEYRLTSNMPQTSLELLQTMLQQNADFKDALEQGKPSTELDGLIALDLMSAKPLTYEDFLPVSAAGIFQSNLGDEAAETFSQASNQEAFEQALGSSVINAFDWYQQIQSDSLKALLTI
ncbi:2-oxoadipate dioxygenase/decarboxylase HglS [Leucothrix pacifica]|uniref:2-oxoadipate dioxygenase/decarboxylase n=1 Tax=Leucothrix pacifica TaxID=1247513 RepID=A0A317C367_9GAMM|nr:DUF1338 family protein [Leucothrix pacifica]PWQ92621.1 DUF1338 domain-containing protein [Leucothrix pacifica]